MVGGSSLTAWFALCFWRRRFLIIICMLLVILLVTIYNTKCAFTNCEEGLTFRPLPDLNKRALRERSSVKFFPIPLLAETQLTAKSQQNITQENVSDGKQLPKQVTFF